MLTLTEFQPDLAVQAYLRFSALQHRLHVSNYPSHATGGSLPVLRDGSKLIPNESILAYLQSSKVDLDAGLSPIQRSTSIALVTLLRNLNQLLKEMQWMDEEHFTVITAPRIRSTIPFPFNLIAPYWLRMENAGGWMKGSNNPAFASAEDGSSLSKQSGFRKHLHRLYESFELRLSQGGWVLDTTSPTLVDAVLFGHLSSAYMEPLQAVLWSFPNLAKFRERVHQTYFASGTRGHLLVSVTGAERSWLRGTPFAYASSSPMPLIPSSTATDRRTEFERAKATLQEAQIADSSELSEGSRNSIIIALGALGLYLVGTGIISFGGDDEVEMEGGEQGQGGGAFNEN